VADLGDPVMKCCGGSGGVFEGGVGCGKFSLPLFWMSKFWTIQWKAVMMLVAFAVNFCVVCHCAASAAPVGKGSHCCGCCGSHEMKGEKTKGSGGSHGCQGMQAVKFNLLEKQVSSSISSGEQPVMLISFSYSILVPGQLVVDGNRAVSDQWVYKHAPPDLQVLYQRFLI
jgi:hypothetical protein